MLSVAIALPAELADRTAAQLRHHGHQVLLECADSLELAAAIRTERLDCVITSGASGYLDAALVEVGDAAGVRIVVLAASDVDRRHAVGLGLREVVAATASWEELEAMLVGKPDALADQPRVGMERPAPQTMSATGVTAGAGALGAAGSVRSALASASEATSPAATKSGAARDRGTVIAVWGPAGSPGRTTLAIALAAELAAAGYSVALADADTHSGSVAPSLGLLDEAPGFAAACRLAGNDSLTGEELERIGQRYLSTRGGFWVLTGIGTPSRWPELSADRVAKAIAGCRDWVDYTVLDTGFSLESDEAISSDPFAPRRNAATITALAEADQVLAVGAADPVGLARFLRAHADLLELVEPERVTIVMNKVRASAIGLNPSAQVAQTLQRFGGITAAALIPYDRAGLDAAILAGKTVQDAAGRSPVKAAVTALVASLILPQQSASSRRTLRSRFAPVA